MTAKRRIITPRTLCLISTIGMFACDASTAVVPPKTDPLPAPTPTPSPNPNPTNPNPNPNPVIPPPVVPVGTNPTIGAENCAIDRLSPARVYGNKLKTLLTGVAMTDAELTRLKGEPEAIGEMVEGWFDDPRADTALRHFFEMSFQQDNVTGEGLMTMLKTNNINWGRYDDTRERVADLLIQNFEQSFARTALKIVRDGRPFNETVTTDTYEMTTAMMVFYSYLDHRHVTDEDQFFTRPMNEVADFVGLRNQADEAPPEQTLNPNNANFMKFWLPAFDDLCIPGTDTEFPFQANAVNNKVDFVFKMILGRAENVRNRAENNTCRARPRVRNPLLRQADFSDWRTVRIRRPASGETPTRFYRLPQLRSADELVTSSDRVGFFTTIGFFGTWPTNEDNSSRVTINQTLITALGESFDGTTVVDFSPPNLDAEHSTPGSACYGCHQTLDPMREYFRQSYSWAYGEQHDDEVINLPAHFVFRGVEETGQGVRALANILATHPDFAPAWVQKVCYYANAKACEKSAEFDAVVEAFRASNFDFRVMVRELFKSPLVTNTACVNEKTAGEPSIARRDQFCAILSNRLGVDDICALDTLNRARTGFQRNMVGAVSSVPADTVSRGEPAPITISETGLFTRATREVVCTMVGESAFDTAFGGLNRNQATLKMVTDLMGLNPSDPRHEPALEILRDHVTDGIAAGANQRNALRSALAVACMSPGVSGVGF